MASTEEVAEGVRRGWAEVAAPPLDDLQLLVWGCGEDAWRALAGVRPVDVDTSAPGFLGCTPLRDLPPRAAAAYLGTYVLSLLEGLAFQEDNGLFYDVITRAHVLSCLGDEGFWEEVVAPHLPGEARASLRAVGRHLADRRVELALPPDQAERIAALALAHG